MDFELDRRKLLKATGAGIATATVVSGTAAAVTNLDDLPGDGDENPYELSSFEDLLAIDQDVDANYVLTDNIEFEGEAPITPLAFEDSSYGEGIDFTGTLDGQGYEVRDFQIDGSSFYDGGGLFGSIGEGGVVKNLDIVNIQVVGDSNAGGLTGEFEGGETGEIENVSVTGQVSQNNSFYSAGGLIGVMGSGTVTGCSSSAEVNGDQTLGGVVGLLEGGSIAQTYADGDVQGESPGSDEGGFVGEMTGGSITRSFAAGAVIGGTAVGGFVGRLRDGGITKSYARGEVGGNESVGGFAGIVEEGSVEEVYSSGTVFGGGSEPNTAGGLIGFPGLEGPEPEGFVAIEEAHATSSYWDIPASGQGDSNGGVGLGTEVEPADEMTGNDAPENMDGFDFEDTWVAVTGDEEIAVEVNPGVIELAETGDDYPVLGWQVEGAGEEAEGCIDRRDLGRGDEDRACPEDTDLRRGQERADLDRETGRDGAGSRRGRGR